MNGTRLTDNSFVEEGPQCHEIADDTDLVADKHLRSQSPPEESKITRMSEPAVDPARDQLVALLPCSLWRVIEVCPSLSHSYTPDELTGHHKTKPSSNGVSIN